MRADQLDATLDAAIGYWKAASLDTGRVAALHEIDVSIVDLDGVYLGLATTTSITIDLNGAGHGWFVDDTPEDDEDVAASEQLDLLPVVMHELGHILGLEDVYDDQFADDLMYGWLGSGVRRLPTPDDVDAVLAAFGAS